MVNGLSGASTLPSLQVALLNEGTYPFSDGGVSTWCHALCERLTAVEFSIYTVTGTPAASEMFPRLGNVTRVSQIPQWGTEHIVEYGQPGVRGLALWQRHFGTQSATQLKGFVEPFERLTELVLQPSLTRSEDADAIVALHRFFQVQDYTAAFRSPHTFDAFRNAVLRSLRSDPSVRQMGEPSVLDLAIALRWLHNFLMPLALPLPQVDVMHATIASVVGLLGLVAKRENGTPFLLTEHGVYLRERYLGIAREPASWFLKRVALGLAGVAVRLCYLTADVVSPVCAFNTRWETRLGVSPERIQVIHNGVDTERFRPRPERPRRRPTVVAAARVYPLKDILTMIRATAVARRYVPEVRVRVFGSLQADPPYVERCRSLVAELGLEDAFELVGPHPDPSEIFHEGDISVLSSISEGFPYTVLESMASGKPVVATDVGGVGEALGDCGVLVPAREPEPLGLGMASLLVSPALCEELGQAARQRVLDLFRQDRTTGQYLELYRRLAHGAATGSQLLAETAA